MFFKEPVQVATEGHSRLQEHASISLAPPEMDLKGKGKSCLHATMRLPVKLCSPSSFATKVNIEKE